MSAFHFPSSLRKARERAYRPLSRFGRVIDRSIRRFVTLRARGVLKRSQTSCPAIVRLSKRRSPRCWRPARSLHRGCIAKSIITRESRYSAPVQDTGGFISLGRTLATNNTLFSLPQPLRNLEILRAGKSNASRMHPRRVSLSAIAR